MKAKFELKTWLSENRNLVIEKYNELTKEANFNGISLKEFMSKVLTTMGYNNVKSEKKASSTLPHVLGGIYFNACKIEVIIDRDEILAEKYKGTAFMALV